MQRPYNDRWERTRRHLLRNLFDYHGDLSPIAEEPGSDSSEDRPYSPLPDLIVEREPNRHDHSEQFYELLAVRMRRYYKRLFIDGVSEPEASLTEDIPDFEINRSLASTVIIDTNNHTDEESRILVPDETREEFISINNEDEIREVYKTIKNQHMSTFIPSKDKIDSRNITVYKEQRSETQESSRNISILSDVVTNEDESEVICGINKTQETQTPEKDAPKSIETELDLVETCHRTSTTVAQVHAEMQRVRAPCVFEDGSPVLMPKAHELSRSVFGNISLKVRNIMSSVRDDEDNQDNGVVEEIEGHDRIIQQVSREIDDLNQCKIFDENSDLELEGLIKSADNISNKSQELIESCEEEESSQDSNRNETPQSSSVDLHEFDDENRKAIEEDSESPLRTSESDGIIQIQNEDSIGPNEFELEIDEKEFLEQTEHSFEMALSKGIFNTKNARINQFSSSDEKFEDDSYENQDFEPVEEMRGTIQTRMTETLRRESTLSKESPLVKIATPATAEHLEEDNFEHDDRQINGSDTVMTETREEGEDRSLQIDLCTSPDNSGTDANGTDDAAEELSFPDDLECVINAPVDKENETREDANTKTPSVATIRTIADVCDDIWSVSPVNINFNELPPTGHEGPSCKTISSQKKRASDSEADINAPMNKKKRYNNIAIQTAASKESTANWDDVKNNFFVGKPLVFRLCSCHDHVCPQNNN